MFSVTGTVQHYSSLHVRDSGIREIAACGIRNQENFCGGIQNLGFGIRNTAQGIRNPTNDLNAESIFHRPRIRNPQRRNPESFPYMGRLALGADP